MRDDSVLSPTSQTRSVRYNAEVSVQGRAPGPNLKTSTALSVCGKGIFKGEPQSRAGAWAEGVPLKRLFPQRLGAAKGLRLGPGALPWTDTSAL